MVDVFPLVTPFPRPFSAASPSGGTMTIDNAVTAVLFQVPPGGMLITHGGLYIGSVTGTPPQARFSLQGVTGGGNTTTGVDGVIKGGGTAKADFAPSVGWQWRLLDQPYQAAGGEVLALVAGYAGVGSSGSNNYGVFAVTSGGINSERPPFPVAGPGSAGSNLVISTNPPVFAVRSADRVFGMPAVPLTSLALAYGPANECGVRFRLPAGTVARYRLDGVRFSNLSSVPTGLVVTATVYDLAGNVMAMGARNVSQGSVLGGNRVDLTFGTAVVLEAGTEYRLALSASAAGQSLAAVQVAAAADLAAYPLGTGCYLTSRTLPGGEWADDPTVRPFVGLIIGGLAAGGEFTPADRDKIVAALPAAAPGSPGGLPVLVPLGDAVTTEEHPLVTPAVYCGYSPGSANAVGSPLLPVDVLSLSGTPVGVTPGGITAGQVTFPAAVSGFQPAVDTVAVGGYAAGQAPPTAAAVADETLGRTVWTFPGLGAMSVLKLLRAVSLYWFGRNTVAAGNAFTFVRPKAQPSDPDVPAFTVTVDPTKTQAQATFPAGGLD